MLAAGAGLSLAFAPFGLWPLAIVLPALLFAAWHRAAPRRAAWLGFLFTAGTFLAGTYWLYHSIHVIGKAPLWLAIFLMLGLVAIMGAYTALLGYVVARWGRGPEVARWLVVLPAGWVLTEWFRGWFLSGFPWLALGYSQVDSPLAGFAPVIGVYGVSLLVAIAAGALAMLVHSTTRRIWLLAAVVIGPMFAIGTLLTGRQWTVPVGEPISVAIVQGAVPQEVKWSDEYRDTTLDLYRSLTRPYLGADLIVWPEAALPALAHELNDFLAALWAELRAADSELVLGLLRYDFDTRSYYNSLLALSDRTYWYDKRRLVPFGEFFPVPQFVRDWMKLMSLPYTDFVPGAADQPPLPAGGVLLGSTICYEDAYGAEQLDVLETASVLVNVTNDAWFGDSTARHQHLEISRLRALEAGRPLLRAANDGISAILGPLGEVEQSLTEQRPGVIEGKVQPRTGLTPYARTGNWPVIVFCVLAFVLGGVLPGRARLILP
ncbi:MAG TPA: apolipoprotein N-acyltransferase [Steroidobacteraceae bacterium]|nr:apolipoprotein N-acyltransferase [Steroidobacteraceae bacterium]